MHLTNLEAWPQAELPNIVNRSIFSASCTMDKTASVEYNERPVGERMALFHQFALDFCFCHLMMPKGSLMVWHERTKIGNRFPFISHFFRREFYSRVGSILHDSADWLFILILTAIGFFSICCWRLLFTNLTNQYPLIDRSFYYVLVTGGCGEYLPLRWHFRKTTS